MRLLLLLLILTIGNLGAEYDAVLVRSDVYADWIIAQAYSHKSGVPIIATSPESIDPQIREQLQGYRGFGFDRVLIIGGEKAVAPAVQRELEGMGYVTHRISEADRSGTSARVAVELFSGSDTVILANGVANEALLVAGRLASATGNPVLFVRADEIPPSVSAALQSIGVDKIILVDIELSEDLKSELRSQGYDLEILRRMEEYRVGEESRVSRGLILLLVGIAMGVVSVLLAGRILKRKERVPITVLTEDERRIISAINEQGGELTQDQLPELTSFSRPKISRVISELVERGVLSKEPYGRTQKIAIKKELVGEGY
ncbi:MAG: cell wall-binding repeat-containing protein [Candidatus Hydrothermarchaeaceae archaeon]